MCVCVTVSFFKMGLSSESWERKENSSPENAEEIFKAGPRD